MNRTLVVEEEDATEDHQANLTPLCYFVQYFDCLRVPELMIKNVKGLNLVSVEGLFIGTVNWTENVGFAYRLLFLLL